MIKSIPYARLAGDRSQAAPWSVDIPKWESAPEGSFWERQFRQEFHVPYAVVTSLYNLTKDVEQFRDKEIGDRKRGPPRSLLFLKILATIYQIARGTSFLDVERVSLVSGETARRFSIAWLKWLRENHVPEWVHMPTTDHEIKECTGTYTTHITPHVHTYKFYQVICIQMNTILRDANRTQMHMLESGSRGLFAASTVFMLHGTVAPLLKMLYIVAKKVTQVEFSMLQFQTVRRF